LVLDEPHENDEVFERQGITFLVTKDLYKKAEPIAIDFAGTGPGGGFKITSNLASEGTCCC
jgi:Fe-S cluster assembly iron-binding protein IscA